MYTKILKNVTGKTRKSIKNALDFREKIKSSKLPEGYVLISLDVVSLFTNIPNELVLKAIDLNWFKIKKHTTLPKAQFVNGLKMVMENGVFSFNDVIHQQTFGSPMGSSVSPILADLVMEMLEDEVFTKLNFCVPFYYRYVDDSSTGCPKDKVNYMKDVFNSLNEIIQFTIEEENERRIAFLDVLLIRDEQGFIKTDWYHKETWSGRYLNFQSCLPFSYKRNTISILTEKMYKLADVEFHDSNKTLILDTLKENGYPEKLVKNTIEQTIQKMKQPKPPRDKKEVKYVSVPYVNGLFEKIKTLFKEFDVEVVGTGENTLKQNVFTKLKDKVPKSHQSNLIYMVTCSCGIIYG